VDLLVATTNRHKLEEIRRILGDLPLTLDGLDTLPAIAEVEETGLSFAENARLKARYYATQAGRVAVAEDSGLEIDALDGEPGIHSARFNGNSYPEKFEAIYTRLRERGVQTSQARFVCALAVDDGVTVRFEATATIKGHIARRPGGAVGFGYDPIFYYPPFGCTLAEVSADRKAQVSHRGQAFRALRAYLATVA
jgi:XTP/dITP diphosphohydrolase